MAISIESVRRTVRQSSGLQRLVAVNAAVFVLLRVISAACLIGGHENWQTELLDAVTLPVDMRDWMFRPWTLLVYMVSQYEVLHLVFNMLWLYLFGSVFSMVMPMRNIIYPYAAGGLSGAIGYGLFGMLFPAFAGVGLIGSSAAVMAVMAAPVMAAPDFGVRVFILGEVRVKWIAAVVILIELIGFTAGNAGGHVAHLCGLACGMAMGLNYRKVRFRFRAGSGSTGAAAGCVNEAQSIDMLLDKVRRSGYASLTADERRILFRMSDAPGGKKQ